jgi:hypothetical protein
MHESSHVLRRKPPTKAARDLKELIVNCATIKDHKSKENFLKGYRSWHNIYDQWFKTLPQTSQDYKDIKETLTTVDNALTNMFHFLEDKNIASTTNEMEGFFSQLKSKYKRHNGLSKEHKIRYLKYYCYYQNQQK